MNTGRLSFYLLREIRGGDVLDILVKKQRDKRAAKALFRKFLKGNARALIRIVTDKLRSYDVARRGIMPSVMHSQGGRWNNRAEFSHQVTGQRERQMRRFKSYGQAQSFLSAHG